MSSKKSVFFQSIFALILSIGGFLRTANAVEVPILYYSTLGYPSQFFAMVTGMPDLDQIRRAIPIAGKMGLPDDGVDHCAPTAAANLLGFLSMKGYRELLPMNDAETWDDRTIPGENDATSLINALGSEMGTGSDGSDFLDVALKMKRRLNEGRSRSDRFKVETVSDYGCYTSGDTSTERLYREIANGNLIQGNLDYYVEDSSRPGFLRLAGSHAIVITGAMRNSSGDFLTIVDPSSGGDSPYYQGEYHTNTYEVTRETVNLSDGACVRTLTSVLKEDSIGVDFKTMLTGLIVIKPPRPYEGSTPLALP